MALFKLKRGYWVHLGWVSTLGLTDVTRHFIVMDDNLCMLSLGSETIE